MRTWKIETIVFKQPVLLRVPFLSFVFKDIISKKIKLGFLKLVSILRVHIVCLAKNIFFRKMQLLQGGVYLFLFTMASLTEVGIMREAAKQVCRKLGCLEGRKGR